MPLKAAVFALSLGGLAAAADPYQSIVGFEKARSLGRGALAGYLASKDPTIAARAALAIGRTKDPHGAALLERQLRDRDDGVRAMAVYGLGLIANGAGASTLIGDINKDRSSAVRVAAIDAVGRYETAHALRGNAESSAALALVASMKADRDPRVRARAATAFEAFRTGLMGDLASRELVNAFTRERDDDVRWHIMWTIYRGYAIRVPRDVLTSALRDRNELVRIEAVRAYGRLKNKDAIAALQPLLNDASWRVQLQTMESIRALRGDPPTDHLKEMPPGVHVPPVHVQNYMDIAPLPRPTFTGKPGPPPPQNIITRPRLHPTNSALMDGPMPGPHPRVRIRTTKGTLVVTLYPEWAPLTVENFLSLTNRGYFDGLRWFRIVPDFVVQTGDTTNTGDGDAGYSIPAEENPLEQRSYVISMGLNYKDNSPIRDSAGTQFYITLSPQLHLNRDFTVFGEVTSGFDVLGRLVESDRMERVEQIPDGR